jgi:hypothetical protein
VITKREVTLISVEIEPYNHGHVEAGNDMPPNRVLQITSDVSVKRSQIGRRIKRESMLTYLANPHFVLILEHASVRQEYVEHLSLK